VINLLASLKEAWETILTKPEVIKSSAKSSAPTGIRI
jgi:hypothetical protein